MFKRPETEIRVKAVNQIGMAESSQAQIFEHQKSQYSLGSMEWRRASLPTQIQFAAMSRTVAKV
jgi:hypothetical protein